MSLEAINRKLRDGEIIVIDGATGTELERRGAPMHKGSWCALATESHPDVLRVIHEDYIRAGASVIAANTFATTREVLEPLGLGDKFEPLNRQAVEIAVEARERTAGGKPVVVAGSISHTRPQRRGAWSPEASDVQKFEDDCCEMAAIHKAAGCDLILAEMMGDPDFTPCVIRAARANDLPVWVGISAIRRPDGILGTYTSTEMPYADVVEPIVAAGGEVMGVMHSKADVIPEALDMLRAHWSGPLMAYPDTLGHGDGDASELTFDHIMASDAFVDWCDSWLDAGVQIVGGCCGFRVEHIARLTDHLRAQGRLVS